MPQGQGSRRKGSGQLGKWSPLPWAGWTEVWGGSASLTAWKLLHLKTPDCMYLLCGWVCSFQGISTGHLAGVGSFLPLSWFQAENWSGLAATFFAWRAIMWAQAFNSLNTSGCMLQPTAVKDWMGFANCPNYAFHEILIYANLYSCSVRKLNCFSFSLSSFHINHTVYFYASKHVLG